MSDCVQLDNSSGENCLVFEDFEEWSSYSVPDRGNAKVDSCFGEWSCFPSDRSSGTGEEYTSLPCQTTKNLDPPGKVSTVDWMSPLSVFQTCFQTKDRVENTDTTGSSSLFQLLQDTKLTPAEPVAVSSEAASLWHRLLCEPKIPSLMDAKTSLQSYRHLINTLQLTHSETPPLQSCPLPSLEEPENSPVALIQTKLLAPSRQEAPGFLYQVSRQWLSNCNVNLMSHQHRKGLFQ